MDGPLLVGQARHLYFFLGDRYGTAITGAVAGSFTVVFIRNGSVVSPHGMLLFEIDAVNAPGWYHWTNKATGEGYTPPGVETCTMSYKYTGQGALMHQWFSLYETVVDPVTDSALLASVNAVIEYVLKGQHYKIGEFELTKADLQALFAIRRMLQEELENYTITGRQSLAALLEVA